MRQMKAWLSAIGGCATDTLRSTVGNFHFRNGMNGRPVDSPPPFSPPTLHPPPPPLPSPSLPPWADTRFSVAALVEVLSDGGVLSYRRGCIGTCLIFPRPVKSAAMRTVKQGVGRFSKRRWRPVSERLERLEHGVWIGPFPLRCCMLPRLIQMFS